MRNPFGRAFWRGFGSMMLYGGAHSVLASPLVKQAVRRRLGTRAFNTYYRLGYNAIALPAFLWVLWDTHTHPGETVYAARGGAKWARRIVGSLAMGWLLWGGSQVGLGRLSGLGPAWKGVSGENEPDPPESQSPTFAEGAPKSGPFARQRHPLNFAIPFAFWGYSPGTQSWLGLNFAITLYAILGSYLSDARLRARYGQTYERYRQHVPLLWPRLKPDEEKQPETS